MRSGDTAVPVTILRGSAPGPRLLLIAGIHGDELNGVAAVQLALRRLARVTLAGELVCVPVANPAAFAAGSRYLPGAVDLNRCFPGDPSGSEGERLARALFDGLVLRCDAVLDLHTAPIGRSNLPHVRGRLKDARVLAFARAFGVALVLDRRGHPRSLRCCATEAGVPTLTFEAGTAGPPERRFVREATRGVDNVLGALGMLPRERRASPWRLLLRRSRWVRAPASGTFTGSVPPGALVRRGTELGRHSPLVERARGVPRPRPQRAQRAVSVVSPLTGVVLGIAEEGPCTPGAALCHVAAVRRGLHLLERSLQEPQPG